MVLQHAGSGQGIGDGDGHQRDRQDAPSSTTTQGHGCSNIETRFAYCFNTDLQAARQCLVVEVLAHIVTGKRRGRWTRQRKSRPCKNQPVHVENGYRQAAATLPQHLKGEAVTALARLPRPWLNGQDPFPGLPRHSRKSVRGKMPETAAKLAKPCHKQGSGTLIDS